MSGCCILVVDDHEVVRAGLRSLLGSLDWVGRCVGAGSGADAIQVAHRYEPRVAVIDLCVGEESGLDICRDLLRERPETRVLLMSGAGRVTLAVARAAGAHGFVGKDWPAGAMVEAVRLAASGRAVFTKQEDDHGAAGALT